MNVLKKILSWFNCKPIQILFQGLSYFCIVYTYVFYCLHCWGSFCPIWMGVGGGATMILPEFRKGSNISSYFNGFGAREVLKKFSNFFKTHLIPVFGSPKTITPSQIFLKSYGLPPPPLI